MHTIYCTVLIGDPGYPLPTHTPDGIRSTSMTRVMTRGVVLDSRRDGAPIVPRTPSPTERYPGNLYMFRRAVHTRAGGTTPARRRSFVRPRCYYYVLRATVGRARGERGVDRQTRAVCLLINPPPTFTRSDSRRRGVIILAGGGVVCRRTYVLCKW